MQKRVLLRIFAFLVLKKHFLISSMLKTGVALNICVETTIHFSSFYNE